MREPTAVRPRVASAREYMRSQLPLVFRTPAGAVAVDMLEALETVLDPIVAVLDGLPGYLDAGTAPDDVVDLLAAWLGVEDVASGLPQRRAAVRLAAELSARRGTRAGLELALATAFPSLPLTVQDAGAVRWKPSELDRPVTAGFTVQCATPLDEQQEVAVLGLIRRFAPAGVRARLRVRERRRDGGARG